MSKELEKIVRKIQFEKDWTIEEVAKSIGYSRVHLAREMKKTPTSELEHLLKNKFKDMFQNVSSSNGSMGNANKAIQDLQEWQVRIDSTIYVLLNELAPVIAASRGKSNVSVLSEMKKDIDFEIDRRISAMQSAG